MIKSFLSLCLLLFAGFAFDASAQGRDLPDFAQIVERHGASVVNISTTQARPAEGQPRMPQLDENDPFYDF
jgi:serine protease Do